MARYVFSRRIEAPPDEVFRIASDIPNAADHVSQITKIEMLTDGPVGVGTRFRETRVMMGKEATETMEVVEFEPPSHYVLTAHSCGNDYRTTLRFEPLDDGRATNVVFDFDAKPTTLIAKVLAPVMAPLMKGMMKKCIEGDLDDLQAAAESSGSDTTSSAETAPAVV